MIEDELPVRSEASEAASPPPPDPEVTVMSPEDIEKYVGAHGVYPNLPFNQDPDPQPGHVRKEHRKKRNPTDTMKSKCKKIVKLQSQYGMSVPAAMRKIGYSKEYSQAHQTDIKNHPAYIAEKTKLMEALLLKDSHILDKVARTMIKGLKAKRVISAISGNKANGGTTDFIEVPDMQERRKSAELIARSMKQLGEDSHKDNNTPINFNVLIEMVEKAERERGLGAS
jgi:hypothetical protein